MLSFHLYPESWGRTPAGPCGKDWIVEHVRDAKRLRKPAFLGEFGLLDKATRDAVYAGGTDAFTAAGGTGELYRILSDVTDDGTPTPTTTASPCTARARPARRWVTAGAVLRRERSTFPPVADDDTVTAEAGTTAAVRVVSQGPFVYFGASDATQTVSADLLTGLSCEGGAPPDLTKVHGVYLFLNTGTFLLDNLRAGVTQRAE